MATIPSFSKTHATISNLDYDIALITETNIHCVNKYNHQQSNTTPREIIEWGKGKGTGVSIINKDRRKGTLRVNFTDEMGRFISVTYSTNKDINILLVYAPASNSGGAKKIFIDNLHKLLNDHKITHQILAGDFNNKHEDYDYYGTGLRDIIHNCDMLDVGLKSNIMTFKSSAFKTEGRLDRIYINRSLMVREEEPIVYSNIAHKSDHHPISYKLVLSIPTTKNLENSPWRLDNRNINNPETHKIISDYLKEKHDEIDTIDKWLVHKKIIRDYLKKYQNIKKKEKHALRRNYKRIIHSPVVSPEYKAIIQERLVEMDVLEEKHREWENKIRFQSHRESPSRLMTHLLKKSKKEVEVHKIKDKNGKIISDPTGVNNCFQEFYQDLYDNKPDDEQSHIELLSHWKVDRSIATDLNLNRSITKKEVEKAIKQMNPHKSPGKDGINAKLYQDHIGIISKILSKTFTETLSNNREINPSFKEGIITTLFKKGDDLLISNRRPITLLNTDYKILSKVINNRLLPVTQSVINKYQNGFVPKRFIQDNIQIMKEIIDHSNREKLCTLVTFFDFNKAFDSISHNSISRTLAHVGIHPDVITLVINLLKDTRNKVKVNNTLTGEVEIRRGTKQGDPISPTIFALVIEPLLQSIINDNSIKGIRLKGLETPMKVGAFADDLASVNSSVEDLNRVREKIKSYCKGTSSSLNDDKTVMIATGTNIPTNLPYKLSEAPERYLGLNFTGKGLDSKINQIIKEMKEQLSNWKKEGYTLRSKMAILKTYTLSKLTYHCYIDCLNDAQISQIMNVSKWFIFSSIKNTFNEDENYRTMMTMDRAYAEWEQGGIKLWDLKLRQEAFKIWNLNRLLCLHHDNNVSEFQEWYIKQIKNKKIVSDILRPQVDAWENYRQDHARSTPELRKLKDEIGDIKIVNGIRNDHNQPIKLRDIYKNLTIKKYNSRVRRTDGQSNLQLDLNLQGIFPRIARIVHHKGRNTFFRFFARCLPGINHQRKRCPLNECSLTFSDPYIHFFFNCKLSTKHCNEIVPIVNQLSIKKIHSWSLNAIDLNQISHHEKTFPTLMAIIMNQMWNIICYNLFETDKSNKPPPVMNIAIIRKELSETINIAKWKLLKYLDYQSRINNSNDDVKLKFEFNRNWQTV